MNASIRFLIDEDFDNDILRGVLRKKPDLDIVRAQDVGLSGSPDTLLLEWAAQQERIVLTHDVTTMTAHAYARIADGLPMPGLFAMSQSVPMVQAITDILLIAECSFEGEWENQVHYLPL